MKESEIMSKPIWKSKTFWSSLIVALAPLLPEFGAWVSENPEAYSGMIGGLFILLRAITNTGIT